MAVGNLSSERKNELNYLLSHNFFHLDGRLEVVGMGHAVGDDSWLKCNNRPLVHYGIVYFTLDIDNGTTRANRKFMCGGVQLIKAKWRRPAHAWLSIYLNCFKSPMPRLWSNDFVDNFSKRWNMFRFLAPLHPPCTCTAYQQMLLCKE